MCEMIGSKSMYYIFCLLVLAAVPVLLNAAVFLCQGFFFFFFSFFFFLLLERSGLKNVILVSTRNAEVMLWPRQIHIT